MRRGTEAHIKAAQDTARSEEMAVAALGASGKPRARWRKGG